MVSVMGRVIVTVRIAAPPDRVWRALTVPSEVQVWDGVTPVDVPGDYPTPGHHARWSSKVGPVRLTLHDRVRAVDPVSRFASSIAVGFVRVEEEYRLKRCADGCDVVSDNDVRSSIPGLRWLAVRLTATNVESSMKRLQLFCEAQP